MGDSPAPAREDPAGDAIAYLCKHEREQYDERLHDMHDILGNNRIYGESTVLDDPEKKGGEDDTQRMILRQQCGGNADEPRTVAEADLIVMFVPQDKITPPDSGDCAGNGHREDSHFSGLYAVVLRR